MAQSVDASRDEAVAIAQYCSERAALHAKGKSLIAHNQARSIDWNGDPIPAYIAVDATGNINGLPFSPVNVGNAIGVIASDIASMDGNGNLGVINLLANPMPLRS